MASSRALGTLTIDLVLKTIGLTQGASKAERELSRSTRSMEQSARRAGIAIGTALAAGIGTAAYAIKQTIDNMDELSKASQKVGQSTENFSRLAYAGELADVSVDQLVTTMGRLTKSQLAAEDAGSSQAKIFKALGVSVKDASGNLRESNDVFLDFADVFQKLGGSQEAIGAGMEIFGKSFQQIIPVLKDGSEGLREAFEESDRLGRTLSTEAGESAEQFNDNLTRLKSAAQGLAIEFTTGLLPGLEDASNNLVEYAAEAREGDSVTQDLGQAVGDMARSFSEAIPEMSKFVQFMLESRNVIAYSADSIAASAGDALANLIPSKQAQDFLRQNADDARRRAANVGRPEAERVVTIPGVQVMGNLNEFIKQEAEARKGAAEIEKRIRDAMGKEEKAKKPKKGRSGKSDAEREAEQLERALRRMADAEREWNVELNDNGNPIAKEYADRLADLTAQTERFKEDGIPTAEIEAFTERMKELASSIQSKELAEFQQEFTDQTLELAAAMQGAGALGFQQYAKEVAELDEELANGLITMDMYNERLAAMTTPFEDVSKAIEDEIKMLGMSAEAQEIYNNLKAAGVDANSEFGQSITESTERLQAAREEAEMWDNVQASMSDAFYDVATGAKSAKDALGEFWDSVFNQAVKQIADNFSKTLTDMFKNLGSSSSTSGSSGGWMQWLGSLFGGGMASGGTALPRMMYEVNERGFEMATVGGRDYMLTGSQPVKITPNNKMGGGLSQTNNIVIQGIATRQTVERASQLTGREAQRALARTGR